MVVYTKPQQRKKEESEQLRGLKGARASLAGSDFVVDALDRRLFGIFYGFGASAAWVDERSDAMQQVTGEVKREDINDCFDEARLYWNTETSFCRTDAVFSTEMHITAEHRV